MGLDMYLTKRTYIGANYEHRNVKGRIEITAYDKPINIKFNRISSIDEHVGYWRKANHIHKWFVTHCQDGNDDCGEYLVTEKNLLKLLKDCKEVRDSHAVAADVMPTQQGFFFGGNDYDEGYFWQINETIRIIEELLAERTGEGHLFDVYYSSSW